jgi:mannan endo-1,4-beta-mannosidase
LRRFHEDEKAIETQLKYISKWMLSHIEDGDQVLKKPVLFSEYGLSKKNQDFTVSAREKMYDTILNIVYKSAKRNRSGAGALVWQFLASGMEDYSDDYGIVPSESPSTQSLYIKHSCRLAKLKGWSPQQDVNFKALC